MTKEVLINIILMVSVTFFISAMLMPFIKNLANQIGAVDVPRTRHIHKKIMPKLGGLGIFISFLIGYMVFGEPSSRMNAILIGSFIIIITGVIDDIKELRPLHKFLGQVSAASIIVFYGQILLKDVSAFGLYIDFGIFAYPITLFFILGCINCMNLIDGLDGLMGGISSIYFLTIGIIASIQGKFGLDFVLTFIMLGSTLGFLVHNFNPAKIFAGDSGSMFEGFIIAVISLLGFKNVMMSSLIIPLLILAIPILDTLFAIIRRSLKGESISKADKFHIHHQLLNRNFSQRATVLIIYFINLLFAFASIVYVLKDQLLGYIIYGILLVIIILFVAKTNVVFDHEQIQMNLKNKLNIFKRKK
ncbi:MAG: MraY family glycosyltransferase [Bacilli bacterium]